MPLKSKNFLPVLLMVPSLLWQDKVQGCGAVSASCDLKFSEYKHIIKMTKYTSKRVKVTGPVPQTIENEDGEAVWAGDSEFLFQEEGSQAQGVQETTLTVSGASVTTSLSELIESKRKRLVVSQYDDQDNFIHEAMVEDSSELPSQRPSSGEISVSSFQQLALSRPIQRALTHVGFVTPTKIQAAAIPVALAGRDLCGGAVTGSGKTAAFVIPILERLLFRSRQAARIRVLILVPTRELALQCHQVILQLAQFTDISSCLLAGGMDYQQQEAQLKKRPDILVATPGRLIDHMKNTPSFSLDNIEILVLDEADRMLEVGFQLELEEIVRGCPKERQTMLFSATLSDDVSGLMRLSLSPSNTTKIFVDSNEAVASRLVQEFVRIRESSEPDRVVFLLALCQNYYKKKCIVFFQTKSEAHRVRIMFGLVGLKAAELHGNLSQAERLEALEQFKNGDADFLIATDVAARGLDIHGVETVINYTMPAEYKQYLHRVGRTARAGHTGKSVSLVGEQDRKILKAAIKNSRDVVKQRLLPSALIDACKQNVANMEPIISEIEAEEAQDRIMKKTEDRLKRAKTSQEPHRRPKRKFIKTIRG